MEIRKMARKNLFIVVFVTIACEKFVTSWTDLRWNKRSNNFEPIARLSREHEPENSNNSLRNEWPEIRDFNGQPLHITYYEDLGFFEYSDNDTKAAGICGDVWTTLANFLNFTIILSKSAEPSLGASNPNGTYTGLLELARLNQTDVIPKLVVYFTRLNAVRFSTVLWMSSFRIFAYGQWKGSRTWMFHLLGTDVWTLIFVSIVTLSVASVVTQGILIRYRGKNLNAESFFDHLFYSFATLCNQPATGSSSDRSGSGSKMLNFTIGAFAFLTLIAYNSRLINEMTEESFDAPFHDLETLLDNTNFHIVVLEGSVAHITIKSPFVTPVFGRIKTSPRLAVVTDINELYDKVCDYPNKYVFFDAEDAVAARGTRKCSVVAVGDYYYLTPVAAGFSRRVVHWKSLNSGLMKLREFGLLDAIKKRYMSAVGGTSETRRASSLVIDIDHVLVTFGILCLGIAASLVLCVAENIFFAVRRREAIRRILSIRNKSRFVPPVSRRRGRFAPQIKSDRLRRKFLI